MKVQNMASEFLNNELVDITNNVEEVLNELETPELSSDSGSEISLSEKIIFESNEKRLKQRMTSLQTSIMNLKEQLRQEKDLWKEDMERIRVLQLQQELKCTCSYRVSKESFKSETSSKSSSICNLGNSESTMRKIDDLLKSCSVKQLLELQDYKRKLAETENMCSMELNKVKQSLADLRTLQSIASEWGRNEKNENNDKLYINPQPMQEIFVNHFNINK